MAARTAGESTRIAAKEVLTNPDLLSMITVHLGCGRLPEMKTYGKLATPEVRSTFKLLEAEYESQGSSPDPMLVFTLNHMRTEM